MCNSHDELKSAVAQTLLELLGRYDHFSNKSKTFGRVKKDRGLMAGRKGSCEEKCGIYWI
jgi:hypothetical protein